MLAGANVSLLDLVGNILPITLGNIVGGVSVGVAYWLIHLSNDRKPGFESREDKV
jgi:formate/nitrite transporter FocA (FNT family)